MSDVEDEDRTTAVGLFNYAHSYASSAIALEGIKVKATHKRAPVYYLYYHAIELYLKSYLRAHSVSAEDLSKKYSHRIRRTTNKAKSFGLVLRDVDEAVIDFMRQTDAVIESRYIVTGYKPGMLTFEPLQDTCRYLNDAIREKAYETVGGTHRPSL
ncbi:hypothetical protein [Roseobacter sp.]|uniref:hypothetical protein n=1 Tax=Roseobacter sp. TaxID=1907202 RepID=UPI003859EC83